MTRFWILLFLILPRPVSAGMLDLSFFYLSDAASMSSSTSYGRTFYDLTIATELSKSFYIGWNYQSLSAADNPGTAETLSGTQQGLKLFYFFGRSKIWRLGLAYHLLNTASASSNSSVLKGTGLAADLGAAVSVSDSTSFTLRLNYLSSTYADEFIGPAYTSVGYSRTYIYPSVGLQFIF